MTTRLPHLSDEHHFAIANVAARSAQMEYHIEHTIEAALRHQPKMAEFLLKNLGAERVVGLLKSILIDLMPDEPQAIENLSAEIADLRSERNAVLHWTWGPGDTPETAINAAVRPFREFRYAIKRADEIQELADRMAGVSHALMEWRGHLHRRAASPSPDKPAPPTPPANSTSP